MTRNILKFLHMKLSNSALRYLRYKLLFNFDIRNKKLYRCVCFVETKRVLFLP